MKGLFILLLCTAAVYCAEDNIVEPLNVVAVSQLPENDQVVSMNQFVSQRNAAIIQQDSEVNPDGSYYNVWESDNGIKVQEEGSTKLHTGDVVVQTVSGTISYTDADGNPIVLTYVADENGFQPQGHHLPTPPPIPQAIARALEYVAAHPYIDKNIETTTESENQ